VKDVPGRPIKTSINTIARPIEPNDSNYLNNLDSSQVVINKIQLDHHTFNEINRETMVSEVVRPIDNLFRVDAIIDCKSTENNIRANVLFDSGCNIDIVSSAFSGKIIKHLNGYFIISGTPISVSLAVNTQHATMNGSYIDLKFELLLKSHRLIVERRFYILDNVNEDIILSLSTLSDLGLLGYMQGQSYQPNAPEDAFIEILSHDAHLFPVVDSKLLSLSSNIGDTSAPILVDKSFPLLSELNNLLSEYGSILFSSFDHIGLRVEPLRVVLNLILVYPNKQFDI
jgi:hypothetical protein